MLPVAVLAVVLVSGFQTLASTKFAWAKSRVARTDASWMAMRALRLFPPVTRASMETDFGAAKPMSHPGWCSRMPPRWRPSRMAFSGISPSRALPNTLGSTSLPARPSISAPLPCQQLAFLCSGSSLA